MSRKRVLWYRKIFQAGGVDNIHKIIPSNAKPTTVEKIKKAATPYSKR